MRLRHFLTAAVLAVSPLLASAEPSYKYSVQGYPGFYGSAAAACRSAAGQYASPSKLTFTHISTLSNNPDIGGCHATGFNTETGLLLFGGKPFLFAQWGRDISQCNQGQESDLLFRVGWGQYYSGSGGTIEVEGGHSVTPLPPIKKAPGDICQNGCSAFMTTTNDQYVDLSTESNGTVEILQESTYYFTGGVCNEGPPNTDLNGDRPDLGDGDGPGDTDSGDPGDGNDDPPGIPPSKPNKPPKPDQDNDQGGPGGQGGANSGNDDNDQEPTCGYGDLPPCNTRIDETGTPHDAGDRMETNKLNNEYTKLDNALDDISKKSDKDTSWGVTPGWFQSGSCSPFQFGDIKGQAFRIDYCVAMPYARAVSTFLWVVVTFFAITGMVSRTVGAGARS